MMTPQKEQLGKEKINQNLLKRKLLVMFAVGDTTSLVLQSYEIKTELFKQNGICVEKLTLHITLDIQPTL